MSSVSNRYRTLVDEELEYKKIMLQPIAVPLYSSVTRVKIDRSEMLGPDYWEANLKSPVLFSGAVSTLLQSFKNALFLEIGPHSALAGPIRQICSSVSCSCPYVPAMLRGRDDTESLLSAIGQLFQHGLPINFQSVVPEGKVLTDLPSYPWEHNISYWYESRISKDWRFRDF